MDGWSMAGVDGLNVAGSRWVEGGERLALVKILFARICHFQLELIHKDQPISGTYQRYFMLHEVQLGLLTLGYIRCLWT